MSICFLKCNNDGSNEKYKDDDKNNSFIVHTVNGQAPCKALHLCYLMYLGALSHITIAVHQNSV